MTVLLDMQAPQSGFLKIDIVGTAVVAACLGSVLNPEGVDIFITEGWLWLEEGAHAAAVGDIGFGVLAADDVDLCDDFPWNGSDNTMWTILGRGASEAAAISAQNGAIWGAAEYLNVTNATQVSTGLIAHLYLRYIRLE